MRILFRERISLAIEHSLLISKNAIIDTYPGLDLSTLREKPKWTFWSTQKVGQNAPIFDILKILN